MTMPDYRTMFDDKWLKAWDLDGKEFTVIIERVEAGEIEDQKRKKKERKPVLWFKGAKKPFMINKTIGKTIATLYGNEVREWIGKPITLFPTTTSFGNDTVDCIRVRPNVPRKPGAALPERAAPPPVDDMISEPGAQG
jgi:hypothetical protein